MALRAEGVGLIEGGGGGGAAGGAEDEDQLVELATQAGAVEKWSGEGQQTRRNKQCQSVC